MCRDGTCDRAHMVDGSSGRAESVWVLADVWCDEVSREAMRRAGGYFNLVALNRSRGFPVLTTSFDRTLKRKTLREQVQQRCDLRRRLRIERFEPRQLLSADVTFDFESGDQGFTVDNTGGTILGQWHRSIGRSDPPGGVPTSGRSLTHSFYYGQFETTLGGGRYPVYADHQGTLTSPEIDLCCGINTLSFYYLLGTRESPELDFAEVRIIDVDAGATDVILSRHDGSLIANNYDWNHVFADISAYSGKTIQVEFFFDSGPALPIDPEGWYIDDVTIANVPTTATVSGLKIEDVDGDGVLDTSGLEPGLAGWEIQAYTDVDGDGQLSQSEFDAGPVNSDTTSDGTTDKNGDGTLDPVGYYHMELDPGDYVVVEVAQPDFGQSYPSTDILGAVDTGTVALGQFGHAITVTCDDALEADFGNFQYANVDGVKFEDVDGDGVFDSTLGDEPLQSWEITAYRDDGVSPGVLDSGDTLIETVLTDSNGAYAFRLPPGEYIVVEEQREAWNQSTPVTDVQGDQLGHASGGFALSVISGQSVTGQDFGNYVAGSIHAFWFHDLDANGVQDPGEPPHEGVELTLTGIDGKGNAVSFPPVLTDAAGQADWLDLDPGVYSLQATLVAPWQPSTPLVVDDITVRSRQEWVAQAGQADLPPESPRQEMILDEDGDGVPDLAFGDYLFGSIHGQKFDDANADGVQNPEEVGANGITITLDGVDSIGNVVSRTAVTADVDLDGDGTIDPETERGLYAFADLNPGTYTVTEVVPAGSLVTTPNPVGGIELTSGVEWVSALGQAMLPVDSPKTEQVLDRDDDGISDLMFGNYTAGSITGHKFDDLNGNGIEESNEPRLNGFEFHLLVQAVDGSFVPATDSLGDPLTAITADFDLNGDSVIDPVTERGLYRFETLALGTYRVREMLSPEQIADGWTQTTVDPADIVLTAATSVVAQSGQTTIGNEVVQPDLAVGNVRFGEIAGHKFEDIDGNGIDDAGDPRLNGVSVELLVQAADGSFVPATDEMGNPRVVVTADEDLDGDSQIDPVTERGLYRFENLPPATYRVRESLSALQISQGWEQSTVDPADIVLSPGTTVVAAPGQSLNGNEIVQTDLRFGNAVFGSIHGQKFHDRNGNGVQDAGEEGINGITMTLTGVDGQGNSVTLTTVTSDRDLDADGEIDPETERGLFGFGESPVAVLRPGTYRVEETVPPGSRVTTSNPVNDIILTSRVEWVSRSGQAMLPEDSIKVEQLLDQGGDGVADLAFGNESLDFGDAPAGYPTRLADDGARHAIVDGFFLGLAGDSAPDAELDGQPTSDADGDDSNGVDDEDGVSFDSPLIAGRSATVTVDLTNDAPDARSANLTAWIDFNQDLTWDASERIFDGVSLSPGANTLSFDVPLDSAINASLAARFRLTSQQTLAEDGTGAATDGEVEDYLVEIGGLDFGDAPEGITGVPSYPVLEASAGSHFLVASDFHLGPSDSVTDIEADGQPSGLANGDDTDGNDDEDGVTTESGTPLDRVQLSRLEPNNILVNLTDGSGRGGVLNAWIDFNANGQWTDPGEAIFVNQSLTAGANALSFSVPVDAADGPTYARFELTTETASTNGLSVGEVEDYLVIVEQLGSSFSGRKFQDANGNEIQDADESGLPGWLIYLADDANDNDLLDPDEFQTARTVTTLEDDPGTGNWSLNVFDDELVGKKLIIVEEARPGWQQTGANGPVTSERGASVEFVSVGAAVSEVASFGYIVEEVLPGDSISGLNFGNQVEEVPISKRRFIVSTIAAQLSSGS